MSADGTAEQFQQQLCQSRQNLSDCCSHRHELLIRRRGEPIRMRVSGDRLSQSMDLAIGSMN
jgi:hypothetical protein